MTERAKPRREAPLVVTVVCALALLAACWAVELERKWRNR